MKELTNINSTRELEARIHMKHDHLGPVKHTPPHERRVTVHVEYNELDWELFRKIFGDEDTATAAATIIRQAPPEIQILAIQLINIIKEEA